MNECDYDNIAACIRRRGTKTQKQALRKMMDTIGWELTHKKIAQLESEGTARTRRQGAPGAGRDVISGKIS